MTTQAESEDFLAHHGILGMKWGKHLPGRTEKSHNPKPKVTPSADHEEAQRLRKTPNKALSNQELQKLNSRLQLEKKNAELDLSRVKKGAAAVAGVLGVTGVGILAYNQLTSPAAKAALKAGRSVTNRFVDKYAADVGKILWKAVK